MKVGVRIVVATARGARIAAPRLAEVLRRHAATATFYFNLGPDRLHRWLPGRRVTARTAAAMLSVRDQGFEVGLHGWDCMRWRDRVPRPDFGWTEDAMRCACRAFERLFGDAPRTHAAPGWQMNRHAFRLTQRLGFDYSIDTRGQAAFIPVVEAEIVACPQLPTTLPTLAELIGRDGTLPTTQGTELAAAPRSGRVLTLLAERDGTHHLAAFERLLEGWRALDYQIVSLRELAQDLDAKSLAHHVVDTEPMPGIGNIATQGAVFLA